MSVALARSRLVIWSSRHFASTWSLTSSRLRSRDGVMAENIVPDIAAVELDGIVVDADVAVEGLRDDVEAAGDVRRRLAAGKAARAVHGVDGDGGEPQFLRGLDNARATAALVFHLVAQLGDLGARAFARNLLLELRGDAFIGWLDARLDLADLDQGKAELALFRLAYLAGRQREGGVRNRRIDDRGFRDQAEVDVGWIEAALLGEILERQSGCDAVARRQGFFRVRKDDLRNLALFRRSELVAALLEYLPGILVGDLGPFADLFRRDRDKGYLAIFGRAELGLVIVEIGRQRLGRRRIDRSGLRGVELDVFHGALLVLKSRQRIDQDFRRFDAGRHRPGDLTSQRHPPLFGDKTLFAEAELPDHGLEARRIERCH